MRRHDLIGIAARLQGQLELADCSDAWTRAARESVDELLQALRGELPIQQPVEFISGAKVLVADDDVELEQITAERLRRHGLNAVEATPLGTSIVIALPDYDVVVMDLSVFETLSASDRALVEGHRIVLMSGRHAEVDGRTVLVKPLDYRQLADAVQQLGVAATK